MCMWRKLTWTLINTPHPTRPSSRRVFSKACTTTGAVFPPLACLCLILLYFKYTSIHYPFIPRFVVCLLEDIDLSGTTGPSLRPSCLRSRRLSSTSSVPRIHLLLHFGGTGGTPKWQSTTDNWETTWTPQKTDSSLYPQRCVVATEASSFTAIKGTWNTYQNDLQVRVKSSSKPYWIIM